MDYLIRPLTADDEPLLWEMLYQALQNEENPEALDREIVRRPEFARYVEDWGNSGDAGFAAQDSNDRQLLGAVWCRPPKDGATPALAFAVKPNQRKRGIGAALLTQWVRANPEQSEVTLHVASDHPAVRLYERFGFKASEDKAGAVTMRRDY